MENIKISYNEAIYYITVINVVLGFLFGTFPLISGFIMKNRKYGVYGFIGSIVGGAILGIFLSYPIAAILTWLILRKSFAKDSIDDAVVNENPTEVEIDNTENR
jgi:hypothetical protein